MLGGFPLCPPAERAGRLSRCQLETLSSVLYKSIQVVSGGSFTRVAVMIVEPETRTLEGMMENPLGSSPRNETKRQLRPPSKVRAHNTRPSLPSRFAAVIKTNALCFPLTM